MTFGSLFSGIGGLDLGMERAGMECRWQSEIDPYASRVLAKHWPTTPNLGDIRAIDWRTVDPVDIIAGGYPCQPFSYAGQRNGEQDERHLWPLFADAISVVRPAYALLENVAGHLTLGFGPVLADLAAIGYDARWDCIPAAAVGAPHRRDRVFIVATRRDMGDTTGRVGGCTQQPVMDTGRGTAEPREPVGFTAPRNYRWPVEPGVDRVADGIPNRLDRLRGLGNAVVPQVAEHVASIIYNHHCTCGTKTD